MKYHLFLVRIFVDDWPRAVAFYVETLGMPLLYRDDEGGWAQVDVGNAELGIERVDPSDEEM